ncbi:hypothetical protein M0811_03039 [Anaeramoeba ignava]|uniref:Transmembrane protein 230 n=1 Tax=Anaeramoeba ignava TaxID=1746090 RepID=A0A9Q0L8P9_ANAIG|nr:hypothetical protein M0811_03039 [Anaeramoeba ignava]
MKSQNPYQRLPKHKSNEKNKTKTFKQKIPPQVKKAIYLAIFLLVGGSILIVFGVLFHLEKFSEEFQDRGIPLIILGSLMFLPGFYESMIAYYSYKGYPGYSYDSIPEFY